jgi:hypothetical protein
VRCPFTIVVLVGQACNLDDVEVIPPDLTPDPQDCIEFVVYQDADEDGFGDPDVFVWTCSGRAGFVQEGTDCDDRDAGTFPGAIEVCDEVDRDCDGSPTAGAVDAGFWYRDVDRDGYGTVEVPERACEQPEGTSEFGGDCDDADATVHPNAPDAVCDGRDQDCSGSPPVEAAQQGGMTWPSLAVALQEAGPDRVWVCPGEHPLAHQHRGSLHLSGFGADPRRVVIRGYGERILRVEGDQLEIDGLTMVGGRADAGGAVWAQVQRAELTDVILQDHHVTGDGGALYLLASSAESPVVLRRVDLTANHAAGAGGAVYVGLAQNAAIILDQVASAGNRAGTDGGAIALVGSSRTASLQVISAVSRNDRAGGYGGWLSATADRHVVFRGADLDLTGGRAARGGFLAVRAAGDGKVDLGASRLAFGEATDAGGLIWHEGRFTLDSKVHDSDLGPGSAPTGGLLAVTMESTGHLDWLNSNFHHGVAERGSALWLAGAASALTADIRDVVIRDQRGGPAMEVDPTFVAIDGELDFAWCELTENGGGAISVPARVLVNVESTDLGEGPTDNLGFDISSAGVPWSWGGRVTSLRCIAGACSGTP